MPQAALLIGYASRFEHRRFYSRQRTARINSRLDAARLGPQKLGLVVTAQQLDAHSLHEAIDRLAAAIAARHRAPSTLLLLGIANGGIVLAQRLASGLKLCAPRLRVRAGTIDISFHRDDIGRNPIPKEFAPSLIPHDVNGATVVLVDDVLHTGRTVKAALDELFDHGRPERVELAILVDRGGRLLPVAADYCGLSLAATDRQKVIVSLDAADPAKDFARVDAAAPAGRKTRI